MFKNWNWSNFTMMSIISVFVALVMTIVLPIMMDIMSRMNLHEALSVLGENGYVAYGAPTGDWTTLGDLYTQDIYPQGDSTYHIGAAGNEYLDGYFDKAYVGGSEVVRSATFVVAASDASAVSQAQADYLCDGTADDVDINAAISALPAVGGSVRLTEGNYTIAAAIAMDDNVELILSESAVVTLANATNVSMVTGNAKNNVAIIGGEWDGNKAQQAGASLNIIDLVSCTNVVIRDIYAHDSDDEALIFTTSDYVWVEGCRIVDAGESTAGHGITFAQTDFAWASDNYLSGCQGYSLYAVGAAGTTYTDITFSNNKVNTGYRGVVAEVGLQRVQILDNDIVTPSNNGIHLEATGRQLLDISIVGNKVTGSTAGYGLWATGAVLYTTGLLIDGNTFDTNWNDGIALYRTIDTTISNNNIFNNGQGGVAGHEHGIVLDASSSLNIIIGNHVYDTQTGSETQTYGMTGSGMVGATIAFNKVHDNDHSGLIGGGDAIFVGNEVYNHPWYGINTGSTNNIFVDNYFHDNTFKDVNLTGSNYLVTGNRDYIAPGEARYASGTLTAGNANAICFAWNNPESQDILIKKVVVEVTTAGGTAGSHLDVGIADDATGTNRGVEFFDDLDLNAAQINDSWVGGDGGTQTKWVFCQDTASAVDDWIVGQILDANAASLVGKYYIEYVGR